MLKGPERDHRVGSLTNTEIPLTKWSTDDLERWIGSGAFQRPEDQREAKRILRERYSVPDRRIARWILVFSAIAAVAGVVAAIPAVLALFK
jgi:hypothetical protein